MKNPTCDVCGKPAREFRPLSELSTVRLSEFHYPGTRLCLTVRVEIVNAPGGHAPMVADLCLTCAERLKREAFEMFAASRKGRATP